MLPGREPRHQLVAERQPRDVARHVDDERNDRETDERPGKWRAESGAGKEPPVGRLGRLREEGARLIRPGRRGERAEAEPAADGDG